MGYLTYRVENHPWRVARIRDTNYRDHRTNRVPRAPVRGGWAERSRGYEQPAPIHPQFRVVVGEACVNCSRLSRGWTHPLLRMVGWLRIAGDGNVEITGRDLWERGKPGAFSTPHRRWPGPVYESGATSRSRPERRFPVRVKGSQPRLEAWAVGSTISSHGSMPIEVPMAGSRSHQALPSARTRMAQAHEASWTMRWPSISSRQRNCFAVIGEAA